MVHQYPIDIYYIFIFFKWFVILLYITQKLWAEKQHLKKYHADDQKRYRERFADKDSSHHFRGSRKVFNRVEHLPK